MWNVACTFLPNDYDMLKTVKCANMWIHAKNGLFLGNVEIKHYNSFSESTHSHAETLNDGKRERERYVACIRILNNWREWTFEYLPVCVCLCACNVWIRNNIQTNIASLLQILQLLKCETNANYLSAHIFSYPKNAVRNSTLMKQTISSDCNVECWASFEWKWNQISFEWKSHSHTHTHTQTWVSEWAR